MGKYLIGEFSNAAANAVVPLRFALDLDTEANHAGAEAYELFSLQVNIETGTDVEVTFQGTNGNPFDGDTAWFDLGVTQQLGDGDSDLILFNGAIRNVRVVIDSVDSGGTCDGDVALYMR